MDYVRQRGFLWASAGEIRCASSITFSRRTLRGTDCVANVSPPRNQSNTRTMRLKAARSNHSSSINTADVNVRVFVTDTVTANLESHRYPPSNAQCSHFLALAQDTANQFRPFVVKKQ